MIRITNVKLNIEDADFKKAASDALKTDIESILAVEIVKRSVDARAGRVKFVYSLDVETSADEANIIKGAKNASDSPKREKWDISHGNEALNERPIIVGAGPAGLFAALILSEHGYKPIVFERGKKVKERDADIDKFFTGARLNSESNICFGEGGAGTYSDGKLKTRISDKRCYYVLKSLNDAGAPSSIMYDANPHVGTDILKQVVANIRNRIEKNGGEFIFGEKIEDISIKDGSINSVVSGRGKTPAQAVILAVGHSARDTYEMLLKRGVALEAKPFAMGVRIEHPRQMIDKALYHGHAGNKKLGAASYSLSCDAGGAKVYTFCMCPGGVVVNASSEEGMLCVNGMSEFKRAGENSNSAIVCQVMPDMTGGDPLSGIAYQRKYEQKAFELGGANYSVPAMRVCDFLEGGAPKEFEVMPTALPSAVPADIKNALPEKVCDAIKAALPIMGGRIKDFDMGGAVLSAVEARTSSPVRIVRDDSFQSVNVKGLYPAGEGAGYAGGIVSSAVDGLRAAEALMARYSADCLK